MDDSRASPADVLDISSIDAAAFVIRPVPVELARLLHTALALVAPFAESLGVALELAPLPLDSRLGSGWFLADHTRLVQAVCNLLTNAAK